MPQTLNLGRFSLGVGDRFSHQAEAQLRACQQALTEGVEITPVWNKSNREHIIIGSNPDETRAAADRAVARLKWPLGHFVDADHIGIATVDRFLPFADFYTIDVAESIGKGTNETEVEAFCGRHRELIGSLEIEGIAVPIRTTERLVREIAKKYLGAVAEASRIYRHIRDSRDPGTFITEVSMDETDTPQTPVELLVILCALGEAGVPVETIAPKFTGRFNKGVDYVGSVEDFEKQFKEDLAVISHAVQRYGLPATLKLSVHSGSDKFSIYPAIQRGLQASGAGLHLKTAGTTWLEEVIGLAEAGGEGLLIAKEIYAGAIDHVDELCAPYATVIQIDASRLPTAAEVQAWSSEQYVSALRHDLRNPEYNPHLRQLLHVGYKIAAKLGRRYLDALEANQEVVARNVTENLFARHIKRVFLPLPIDREPRKAPERLQTTK